MITKKALFSLLAGILPVVGFAQSKAQPFSIKGHIGNLNAPAKVYFDYMSDGVGHSDSSAIVNGDFSFKGSISPYSSIRMSLDHLGIGKDRAVYDKDVLYAYFGPGNLTITSKDSLTNATITGSKVYDEYTAYVKKVGPMPWDIDRISNQEMAEVPELSSDTAFTNEVARHHYRMIDDYKKKNFQFAKDNPDSFFSPAALFMMVSNERTIEEAEPVFYALSPRIRATQAGKQIDELIKAHHSLKIGSKAPDFAQPNINGQAVKLSSLQGKIVLLDFWASWCVPCRQEIPNLVKQYEKYKDKGFEILSVSVDTKRDLWLKALDQEKMAWTQLLDTKGDEKAAAKLYGVTGIPATFLVDKDGKLISTNLRGEELNKKLAELFN